ncbi:MAG: tetratricopeptide repeat protein [Phycisphaerae bacterium]|nr:tetratricopeptide repeat protein [Phycisphaerae bacterium]
MTNNNESDLQFPEELKVQARRFFTKAADVAYTLNYDYAIELYLDGLSFWPEAVEEGHQKLRMIALNRHAAGGKKSGFGDKSKFKKGGKSPKDSMLQAEYLASKDPHSLSNMADMIKAANDGGFNATAMWMSDVLLEANLQREKADYKIYILLRDIYERLGNYPRSVQACQLALQMKPGDSDLINRMRDLSAQATMQKGKYGESEDFRDSIQDSEAQTKLHRGELRVRSEESWKNDIKDALAVWKADPDDMPKFNLLIKVLCDTEKLQYENDAIKLLNEAYARQSNFSHKQRAGEIIMKQLRRDLRILQAKNKKDPSDKQVVMLYKQVAKKLLITELEHFKLCVENYPTDSKMKVEYGQRLIKARKFDEAIPLFQEARRDPKHRVSALSSIGQCFFYKEWFPDAIESFNEAYDMLDNKEGALGKELLYNLGRAHECDDNMEEALNNYRKVTQIDFNYRDAKDRVNDLRQKQKETGK